MINSLHLKNFKCFQDQHFELGNLTLLTGLNSTGKSSVIQSLLLLRQSYQRQLLIDNKLLLNGDLVQLGTARDVFCEFATEREIEFRLRFDEDKQGKQWRFNFKDPATDILNQVTSVVKSVYNASLFGDKFHYLPAERIGPQSAFEASHFFVHEHRQLGVKGEYAPHFLSTFSSDRISDENLRHPDTPDFEESRLGRQVERWMRRNQSRC